MTEETSSNSPPARVSAARLDTYNRAEVDSAVARVLEPLGGLGAFIKPGAPVVLKPNFLAPRAVDRAVCTHPEIIRAVARLARRTGSEEVIVTDSPAISTARRCAKRLGLVDDELLKIENADDGIDVASPGADFRHLKLSKRVVETDALINLCKAKTHGKTVITAAVKNIFGAVVGMEKAQWHLRIGTESYPFAQMLVHIHSVVAPCLNILDAVIGMEGNGPGSGDPRPLGFILASDNAHALDAVFCSILGLGPKDVHTLAVAQKTGLLGPIDEIEVVGDDISDLKPNPPWRMARMAAMERAISSGPLFNMLDRFFSLRPAVDNDKCTACGQCAEICAAKVITVDPKAKPKRRTVIDKNNCISCFCCQEICPEGAIQISAGIGARLFRLGTR